MLLEQLKKVMDINLNNKSRSDEQPQVHKTRRLRRREKDFL